MVVLIFPCVHIETVTIHDHVNLSRYALSVRRRERQLVVVLRAADRTST